MTEQTPFRRFLLEFVSNKIALTGLILLSVVIAVALLAPWISPQNPYDLGKLDLMDSRLEPEFDNASILRAWNE